MVDIARRTDVHSAVEAKKVNTARRIPARGSVRTKGTITIPQEIRQELDLREGDEVIFTVEDGKVVMTPATVIPRDQAWFWSRDWQNGEAEADADIAAGRVVRHESDEEFLSTIEAQP